MTGATASAQATPGWDKTFPRSPRVEHQKVAFYNRLGINLVAGLYVPGNLDRSRRHPAIIVGHPYGGVKEQASGLYAQTSAPMALFSAFENLDWISPRPVLFITGDRAHSPHFSEQAFARAAEPRELRRSVRSR